MSQNHSVIPAKETTLTSVKTAVELIDDTVVTTGAPVTTKGIVVEGTDGTNARVLKTDASGELQIDILTVPAPLSTTSGGTEATALRVTLASDSTGLISVDDNGSSLTIDGTVTAVQSGNWTVIDSFSTRSDTFTVPGNGTTVDTSTKPCSEYAIQVTGTGGSATSWNVLLEGSLNNNGFTQILQHTNAIGNAVIVFSGATLYPALYFRSRCVDLVLGVATNIVTVILGKQ